MRQWLAQGHPWALALYGGLASFAAYFSMYAFRKPFTAATYADVQGWEGMIDFKVALVIAQVAGYALSKLIGVKVVSEMAASRRGVAIVVLVAFSWAALVLFAVLPTDWKVLALFLNGLPLGMIWGLVFGYLEGRRTSEVLAAILCASFIVSSGVVKSVALWLMTSLDVTEFWMPAATGLLFFPLLVIAVIGLAQLPPPSVEEQAERMARPPMPAEARRAFLRDYGPGVATLVCAYVLFTALRDLRDNFAAEIWTELGYAGVSEVFTASELPVAVVTLLILASLVLVRDNRRALMAVHAIVMGGALLIGLSTLAFQFGLLSPLAWMILSGLGLYLGYAPFNAMLFDRLVAASRRAGTAGFLIYVADASGYSGSVALTLVRNMPGVTLDWLHFFIWLAYASAVMCMAMMTISALYFRKRFDNDNMK
ncbi:membrane protein [Novosphingobium barchaimii LL02]|uniref:Membrane protein n=1 Tax=Novosphingobium barchaimii LL02 TaxID=1114963 RepID=A0A0J7Y4P5_9SPHN|nr:membrane protein [Novosphingobium barchaimii LL02]